MAFLLRQLSSEIPGPVVITDELETATTIFETEEEETTILLEETTAQLTTEAVKTTTEETTFETEETLYETEEIVTIETSFAQSSPPTFPLTEIEIKIAAKIVMLESGGCSYETKLAVVSVIYNRMELWDKTLKQVIYQQNAFSTAHLVNKKNGKHYAEIPGMTDKLWQECYDAVYEVFTNGPVLPEKVIFFKTKNYHKRGIPYAKIGPLYFSSTP